MASMHYCAPASHLIGALRRSSVVPPSLTSFTPPRCNSPANLHFRFRKEIRQRWSPVFASNTNPSKESEKANTSDDTAKGPPFLTILAGLLVFLGICWTIGSIVLWLIGLIVHPPPLK